MISDWSIKPEVEEYIDDYVKSIINKKAALFIGSGVSSPSGFINWDDLTTRLAQHLNIELDKSMDLTEIAQFYVNYWNGNKSKVFQLILDSYSKEIELNSYHKFLKKLPIKTIWTTNFDNLLEKTFADRVIDVKVGNDSIARDKTDSEITLYKMHGSASASHVNDIILTKEDYDTFPYNYPAMYSKLKSDLLSKSFLFIGYSLRDPDIKNILVQVRSTLKGNPRTHLLIMKKVEGDNKLQRLWAEDLRRYGIFVIFIDDYDEINNYLNIIERKLIDKYIYVSGSHIETMNQEYYCKFGMKLAEKGYTLLYGQSEGIGFYVAQGFMQFLIENKINVEDRFKIWSNVFLYRREPEDGSVHHLDRFIESRRRLLRKAYFVVLFDGGIGTHQEFNLSRELDKVIIPIHWSGNLATEMFESLKTDNYFRAYLSEADIDALENLESSDLNGLLDILERCRTNNAIQI